MNGAIREFLSVSGAHGCRAKICGLRQPGDFRACEEHGADAIGLNFWPRSKRYVEPSAVESWLEEVPGSLARVGVFVNERRETVLSHLESGLIQAAQLHGDESPEDVAYLRERGHCVFKAIGVRDEQSLDRLTEYEADAIVLDAFCPGEYGGSGKTFNWELALKAKRRLAGTPLVLSGGLTVANVRSAIERVAPHAVDVASGVESAPGVKSATKIGEFLDAVRSANSQ